MLSRKEWIPPDEDPWQHRPSRRHEPRGSSYTVWGISIAIAICIVGGIFANLSQAAEYSGAYAQKRMQAYAAPLHLRDK